MSQTFDPGDPPFARPSPEVAERQAMRAWLGLYLQKKKLVPMWMFQCFESSSAVLNPLLHHEMFIAKAL